MNSTSTQADSSSTKPSRSVVQMLLVARRGWWIGSARNEIPAWVHWLWTGLFSTGIAIVLTLFFIVFQHGVSPVNTFLETWLISLCIGYSIYELFSLTFKWITLERFVKWPKLARAAVFVGVPLLGIFVGYALAFTLRGRNLVALIAQHPREFLGLIMIGAVASVVWYLLIDAQSTRYKRETELAQERAHQAALHRQATEAKLRYLQSQIEPHFLFNTLANVVSLIDYNAPEAKRMLEAFIEYLRASLDANRRTEATVGDELQLVERYLQLLQIRLGSRLRYAIVADEAARAQPLAPLMLQPLIENAVKYGIEPKIEGGAVTITARVEGEHLRLTVLDNGMGLHAASTARKGSGTALANIRERLAALYGESASLTLSSEDATQTGTLATLQIPLHAKTGITI